MSERWRGRPFVKMTGSGNDFVFLDARDPAAVAGLETPEAIRDLCSRGTGIGADGAVFLAQAPAASFAIRYYNSDGSRAALCGNASLCSIRLATDWGMAPPAGFEFDTDSGRLAGRLRAGRPEFDLGAVDEVREGVPVALEPGEQRAGFALAGVPHLVILVDNVEAVDVARRGAVLRRHELLGPAGANVNFVAPAGSGWRIRTFERGVEGETLACGTGAVATGILLATWGLASPDGVELTTRSGRVLGVRARREGDRWWPSLSGEGRIVFEGALVDL